MYFSPARSAGSASAPATLAITFGDGTDAGNGSTEFVLVINGIQYDALTFGSSGTIVTGYYNDEQSFIPFVAEYLATEFQSYINANFSSSLTVSRNVNVVTLTTIATNGASLHASCSLPMFPTVPLVGSRYEVSNFTTQAGSFYAVDSGAESLFIAVSKTRAERWMFVLKIVGSDSITPSYSNYTNQVTVNITAVMTDAQVSTAICNAAVAAGFTAVSGSSNAKIIASEFGNLDDGVNAAGLTVISGYPELTSPTFIDALFVSGAGSAEANGLYTRDGLLNSRTRYTNDDNVSFVWDGINRYIIRASRGLGDNLYISTASSPANPWTAIYTTSNDGTNPPPTVRQATTADGVASQRINEQFEAPGGTGWTSITTAGYAAWNDQYQDAILGNYSALIQGDNVNRINAYKDFTATSTCYMRFQFRVGAPNYAYANNQILCSFLDASGNVLCSIALANTTGRFRVSMPGVTTTSVAITASEETIYYGWLEYEKGTGVNAIARVGWSTSPNRPAWPTVGPSGSLVVSSSLGGTPVNNVTRVRFGRVDAAVTYTYTIDDIQIRATPFE